MYMGLSRDEIIELASRYVTVAEMVDFPYDGDIFCLLIRTISTDKVLKDDEGWGFGGYGLCIEYTLEEETKPAGKWLWMQFASLDRFPPSQQVFKLQPPHVAKGQFQNPERTHEIRILKLDIRKAMQMTERAPQKTDQPSPIARSEKKNPLEKKSNFNEKVIPFRRKKTDIPPQSA
jgi:hypothetical protein